MRVRKTLFAAALLLLPALAACDETPVVLPEPTSVSVAATDLRMTVGDVASVTAQVLDQQGKVVQDATPTYSSDNPTVAAVDGSGMVRAMSPGTANVTVAYGGVKTTAKVTVARDERVFVQSLDVLVDSVAFDLRAGTQAVALRAFNGFGQPVCPAVTVRSSDPSVATATSGGSCRINITPAFRGTTTLVVQADGARDSVRVTIGNSGAFVFISGRPAAASLYAGNTVNYAVRVLDNQGNPLANRTVRFDVTSGMLSAESATTDASGTATVQWKLPTELRTLGSTHTLYTRTVLPNGTVGAQNETVFVTAGPVVSIQLHRYNWGSGWAPITTGSISARTYEWVDLGASGSDAYGNPRGDGFTFAATPPAYMPCGTYNGSTMTTTCLYGTSVGTSTFTATGPGGLTKSLDIVFSN
ncbi:MAG TPA: Ig-like domain-containing protein [Longimicrobium sp.]